MSDDTVILETVDLVKSFGSLVATNGVNLKFKKGELSSIIGPNGAGKTTLFNLITGKYTPDSGKILFKGEDITGLPTHEVVKKGIGRAFQIVNTFDEMTVMENVETAAIAHLNRGAGMFASALALQDVRQKAEEALVAVNLIDKADVPCESLSHGDQKFLDIAITLALEPEILFLDEPTAGMAPEERVRTMHLIERLWEDLGLTLVFVEHDMDLVFAISQNIKVLAQGQLLAEDCVEGIKCNEQVIKAYLGD